MGINCVGDEQRCPSCGRMVEPWRENHAGTSYGCACGCSWMISAPQEATVEQVKRDLDDRLVAGIKEYGAPLTADSDNHALWSAYEEALDLACYLRQEIERRK